MIKYLLIGLRAFAGSVLAGDSGLDNGWRNDQDSIGSDGTVRDPNGDIIGRVPGDSRSTIDPDGTVRDPDGQVIGRVPPAPKLIPLALLREE